MNAPNKNMYEREVQREFDKVQQITWETLLFAAKHLLNTSVFYMIFTEKYCSSLYAANTNASGVDGYHGDTVFVQCRTGYYTIHNATNYTTTCTGTWSIDDSCFGMYNKGNDTISKYHPRPWLIVIWNEKFNHTVCHLCPHWKSSYMPFNNGISEVQY